LPRPFSRLAMQRVIPNAALGRVRAVFLTGEAAATLTGAATGPFLAQATHFTGVATIASLVTLSAAALTFLIVPECPQSSQATRVPY
jgi:predicted MFS family arabinose efflux permease